MPTLRRLAQSVLAVAALVLGAAVALGLGAAGVTSAVVGVLILGLSAGIAWVSRFRPGPVMSAVTLAGVLTALITLLAHDNLGGAVIAAILVATIAVLINDPLGQRLAPGVRAVGLPGMPSDDRKELPGPFATITLVFLAALGMLLLVAAVTSLPIWLEVLLLAGVLIATGAGAVRLRAAVRARRHGSADAAATAALNAYAPQFYLYFSGTADGDYQLRMWLPYLERLDLPFAILTREPGLLPRARALTSAPVVLCERLAAMDAVMVPSVRAVFYVNTHHQAVDPVRYLDRNHIHLNHGDSDKPSSYHPMIGMFDEIFVAGQAAIDRFERHGVLVPREKFVEVGRPQVSEVASTNHDPLPCTSVLYAPTWRGGVRDMSFSSLSHGEKIVQALLAHGVRVIFRPHPFSLREKATAATVARIDELLTSARSPECPHLTSSQTARQSIVEAFNQSDGLVTDVSSVASDYLQSGKPFAVADLGSVGGQPADAESFPVLRAAYLMRVDGDMHDAIEALLSSDPLRSTRHDLRRYYLGDAPDSATHFIARAARAVRHPD
ncbi:CDP-glycerol glycerophosphotransferase family protein [Demetria terragena]|uniref:CDP-glycerol glycerophosphotransferase family protein n=1 Tax=Demetria terragena TaxID=63959 RepID=UPI000377BED3|nr:CDP-glycerol glycerophosphotransferase family protein [Demetria terragena]